MLSVLLRSVTLLATAAAAATTATATTTTNNDDDYLLYYADLNHQEEGAQHPAKGHVGMV